MTNPVFVTLTVSKVAQLLNMFEQVVALTQLTVAALNVKHDKNIELMLVIAFVPI